MDFVATPNQSNDVQPQPAGNWWESTPQPRVVPRPPAPARAPQPKEQPETLRLFDEAETAAQSGDWTRAGEIFMTLVEKAPNFGPGYVGLASAAFATGDLSTGVMALEHAISIYPQNPVLHAQLGVAMAHTGHLDRAQQCFLRVLDIEPNNLDAIISLAHLCRVGRNFVEAAQLLEHAHKLAPNSPGVLAGIGVMMLDLGDRASAAKTLAQLKSVAPDHHETQVLEQLVKSA
jgi:Flp pilus assembly protein TadD